MSKEARQLEIFGEKLYFETNTDRTIAVVAEGAVYKVVISVVVKSTLLFLYTLAIKPTFCFS